MRRKLQYGFSVFLLVLIAVFTVVRGQQAVAPADAGLGVSSAISAASTRLSAPKNPAVDTIALAGVGWTREQISWAQLEPMPGRRDWNPLDRTVKQLRERGITVVGVIVDAPGWATPDTTDRYSAPSAFAPDPQKFADFAAAAAARYRDSITHWEIWPAPDDATRWAPQPDPVAYSRLLRLTAMQIRAANPEAKVISGGVSAASQEFLRTLADNGGLAAVDALGVRAYVAPELAEQRFYGASEVATVRALLQERRVELPVWVTEFGWGTGLSNPEPSGMVDEQRQADMLAYGAVFMRAAGAERVFWGSLKDTVPSNFYGLVRAGRGGDDYTQPKAALAALQTAAQQLAGAQPVGLIDAGDRVVIDTYEYAPSEFGLWGVGQAISTTFTLTDTQVYTGNRSAALAYAFVSTDPSGALDPIVLQPERARQIPGQPRQLGMWVFGDGSMNRLSVLIADARGELFMITLGELAEGWRYLSVDLSAPLPESARVAGTGNLELDFPIVLDGYVIEHLGDAPVAGTIFLDDTTTISGPDVSCVRFRRGANVVDVLMGPAGASVNIASLSAVGTVFSRDGRATQVQNSGGKLTVGVGPSPVYLVHVIDRPAPTPTVEPTATPKPRLTLISTRPTATALPTATPEPTAAPAPTEVPAGPAPTQVPLPGRRAEPDFPAPVDGRFSDPAFGELWARSDMPIAAGAPDLIPRSWLWGRTLSGGTYETYDEGQGGYRLVQYFDKSRMEINDPAAPRGPWYVTNGLLVMEMIDGRVQLGNEAYEERQPAQEAVAGDPAEVNRNAPTYATLRTVAYPVNQMRAPRRGGATVTQTIAKDGRIADDPSLARYGVTLDAYEETLGHNIPAVFTQFFYQQGAIYEAGAFSRGSVIRDWQFVMGLPISEPYWARVRIGGVEQDVLVQAFQRRVLTYTPANAPEWRVEMGNVGQHYIRWRYSQ